VLRVIADAVAAVRAGLLIGFPTDTVYGIGADPENQQAMAQLGAVKGRVDRKPIALLAASFEQVAGIAVVTPEARRLGERYWPGPLTLVLAKQPGQPEWIGDADRGTAGVRIPDHAVLLELLAATGPLAATSANLAGEEPARSAAEAEDAFGDRVAVYVPGTAPGGTASTVLDASTGRVVVMRPGPVPWRES
jgi:tRNA threonylcarbamoyl adenosine modification protein (Sua5/YciO/YrdC/YwlC family)